MECENEEGRQGTDVGLGSLINTIVLMKLEGAGDLVLWPWT